MKSYQVVWRGPLHKASGLGIASREYVRALARAGVNVLAESNRRSKTAYRKTNKTKVLIYHYLPHTIDMKRERRLFDKIILNTVWETTRIPKRWRPHMNKYDAICVPSSQNKQALRNSGVKVPLYIAPHGVNTNQFKPSRSKLRLIYSGRRFVFLSIFGFQHRKNPEALLRAYWEEFSGRDNVLLVIKTNGYAAHETEKWIKRRINRYKKKLRIQKHTAPVKIIARKLSPKQMIRLYSSSNAFVLPTRGEGVGLPFLESLSSGLPVIATGWGGHMDFLNRNNAFLVPYKLRPPATGMNKKHSIARKFRTLFDEKGQLWAEVSLPGLKKQMRLARNRPGLCRKKGLQGKKDMRSYSWTRSGIVVKKVIEKVIRST